MAQIYDYFLKRARKSCFFYKTCIISKAIEAIFAIFLGFPATFLYLLASNHQNSETE